LNYGKYTPAINEGSPDFDEYQ